MRDLARAVAALEGISAAAPGGLEQVHETFGLMSLRDWQQWPTGTRTIICASSGCETDPVEVTRP